MSDLNHYSLSKILGSKMKPTHADSTFGNFGLLETAASAKRALLEWTPSHGRQRFSDEFDRAVATAFEDARNGASPDALLWDRQVISEFISRCRRAGLDHEEAALKRRILTIRKNSTRYKKKGIELSKTTRNETRPSIVAQYGHVVEFALVKMRYRHGASIDEILLEPGLGNEFEKLTLQILPEFQPEDVRLAALTIRKSRNLKKADREVVVNLDTTVLDEQISSVRLSEIDLGKVPESAGLIEIVEPHRSLYVARKPHLRATIEQFRDASAFCIVAGGFWTPDPGSIDLRIIAADKSDRVAGIGLGKWEQRLIHDLQPVFNWPIQSA